MRRATNSEPANAVDESGNLVATTMLDDHYATLAETWFGIPAGDVLPSGTPLTGFLAV